MTHTKLGQCGDGSSSDDCIFKNDTVVDVANVFGGLGGLWALGTEEMQDANGQLCEFAVFDELAEVGEGWRMVSMGNS